MATATQTIKVGDQEFTIGKMPFGVLRKNVNLLAAVTEITPGTTPEGPQLDAMVELSAKAAAWFGKDVALYDQFIAAIDGLDYEEAMGAILPIFQVVMGRVEATQDGALGESSSPPASP